MSMHEERCEATPPGLHRAILSFIVRHFVPASSIVDAEARHQAITAVLFGLSMSLWAVVFAPIYVALGSNRCALIIVVAGSICLVNALALRVHGSTRLASNVIAALVLLTLLILSLFSGGFRAPAMIWLPSVPIIAMLLCGGGTGLPWLFLTIMSACVIFALDTNGVLPTSDFVGRSADWLYISSVLGIITCTTLLCLVSDINTGILRKELKAARNAAEQSSRAKSAFLAHMSHELRTPMNGVIGMLELLANTSITKRQQEYVQLAKHSAESLLRVLNDILDFSKIEAGRLEMESIPFALREVIGGTLQTLEVKAAEKRLELACRIPPDVPDALWGDPGRLRQIIVNLVGNAIKFTDRGEIVVSITVQARSDTRARLRFSVRDTGVGIPKDKQARIFEAFAQADSSTTRRFGGTGLGLSISRQLIEMMGGHLGMESEEGQGTEFVFEVEFQRELAPAKSLVVPTSIHEMSVLVVDDNATTGSILSEMLSAWQMKVTVVDGARAALEVLAQAASEGHPIQLVLLDMTLRDMDSLMLAEEIHNEPRLRDTQLILMSSSSAQEQWSDYEALGVVGQLPKPIKPAELLDQILQSQGRREGVAEPPRQRAVATPPVAKPARILVADDGVVNQKVAAGLLQAQGHEVVIARNGRQAVSAHEQEAFDLILMDVEMPELDGLAATAAIREKEKGTGRHVPIVAMTAHAIKGDQERFLLAGMDAHISKPIEPQILYAVVAQWAKPTPAACGESHEVEPSPVIDMQLVHNQIVGGDSCVREVAQLLRDEVPSLVRALQRALAEHSAAQILRDAHALKGAAGVFGAHSVVDLAEQLETMGRSGQLTQAQATLQQLEAETRRLDLALAALIESLAAPALP